jgi:hypothetical protein
MRWLSPEEWADEAVAHVTESSLVDNVFVLFVDDGAETTLWFNSGHAIYRDQVAFYVSEWLASKRGAIGRLKAEEVVEAIKVAYWLDSAGRVYAAIKHQGLREVKRAIEHDSMLLTYGADGFVNVDQAIQTDLGGRASGSRRS